MEAETAAVGDVPKAFKHVQHAKLMKAEDETWISSEDLNTEESSDEEIRRRFKKKNRRQSRAKSASQLAKLIKPGLPAEQPSCKSEKAVLEEISKRTPNSTDSSSIHETWKPIRGSLKFEDIETSGPSGNQNREMQRLKDFYTEMMYNVKHLKTDHVILPPLNVSPSFRVEKTFAELKNTPDVQEKLAFIKKFEEEIDDTINQYKEERAKRLETEKEIYKEMSENKIPLEKGTELFLKLCESSAWEESENENEREPKMLEFNFDTIHGEETEPTTDTLNLKPNSEQIKSGRCDFVKRNIKLVKEAAGGKMAQFWLTDEEKLLQQQLLCDEEEVKATSCIVKFEIPTPTSSLHLSDDEYNMEARKESIENDVEREWPQSVSNAFAFNENEQKRLNHIDLELEKFVSDQAEREKFQNEEEIESTDKFWKQFNSEQALKEINSKLDQLQLSFAEDELKLKEIITSKKQSSNENCNNV